jgi:hypothetical protein
MQTAEISTYLGRLLSTTRFLNKQAYERVGRRPTEIYHILYLKGLVIKKRECCGFVDM